MAATTAPPSCAASPTTHSSSISVRGSRKSVPCSSVTLPAPSKDGDCHKSYADESLRAAQWLRWACKEQTKRDEKREKKPVHAARSCVSLRSAARALGACFSPRMPACPRSLAADAIRMARWRSNKKACSQSECFTTSLSQSDAWHYNTQKKIQNMSAT
jgi:hypothetical protein